jgi:hypothetical protein
MAEVIDALRPLVALAQQAPAMVAMVGDSFDEVMRIVLESGIDVERGLINGTGAALRFGATMDDTKVRELEALLQSGVLDPAALKTIGELGRALTDTAAAPPPPIGPLGLLKGARRPECPTRARLPRHIRGTVRESAAPASRGAILTARRKERSRADPL